MKFPLGVGGVWTEEALLQMKKKIEEQVTNQFIDAYDVVDRGGEFVRYCVEQYLSRKAAEEVENEMCGLLRDNPSPGQDGVVKWLDSMPREVEAYLGTPKTEDNAFEVLWRTFTEEGKIVLALGDKGEVDESVIVDDRGG